MPEEPIQQNLRQLLVEMGSLTEAQVGEFVRTRRPSGEPFVTAMVKSGAATEEQLLRDLGKALNLPFTKLEEREVDAAARSKVPTKVVFQYNIMPIRAENGTLLVATNDPFNLSMVES